MLLFDCHNSPVRRLRVGLTQALGRAPNIMTTLSHITALLACILLCGCASTVEPPEIYDPRKDEILPLGERWASDDQEQILRSLAIMLMRETPHSCADIGLVDATARSNERYICICGTGPKMHWAGIAHLKIPRDSQPGDRVDVELQLDPGLCANHMTFVMSLWHETNDTGNPNPPLHGDGNWGAFVDNKDFNARIAVDGPMHDNGSFCITDMTIIRWAADK